MIVCPSRDVYDVDVVLYHMCERAGISFLFSFTSIAMLQSSTARNHEKLDTRHTLKRFSSFSELFVALRYRCP